MFKTILLSCLGLMLMSPIFVEAQYVTRPAALPELKITEPEVGNFLEQWYDALDAQIADIIRIRAEWRADLAAGIINQEDYEMVYQRDVVSAVEQLKASLPDLVAYATQTISDIRNDEVAIYDYTFSTTMGLSSSIKLLENGEMTITDNGSTTTKSLPPTTVTKIEIMIAPIEPVPNETVVLGQSFTNLTIYKNGYFYSLNGEQINQPEVNKLIEFVGSLALES